MDQTPLRQLPGVLAALLLAGASALSGQGPAIESSVGAIAESAKLVERGLDLGYNLDHPEAIAAFRAASALTPDDPTPHRLAAATLWIAMLFQQGAVTADDYLGQARSNVARKTPPAETAAAFRAHLARSLELAERRLRGNERDADAHFHVGAAHGYLASYTSTVEGRLFGGFGPARRAYREQNRALELDPARKDAGLIVGMYRYGISTLPLHWRLVAGLAGFDGGREHGLRLVEDAAAHASHVQANALFTLIVIYNRESRYDDALRVTRELQRRYPRNRLLWLEEGTTALRAARFAVARNAIEQGLAKLAGDPRPRAFGEGARWRYSYGAALVGLEQIEGAERELRAVLTSEGPGWLRGRAQKELGKLADLAGDRSRAVDAYRRAVRVCRAENDAACADEAARLVKRAYR